MSDPTTASEAATESKGQTTMTSKSSDEITESWEVARERLAVEFPDRKEGILFCIWKLRQDPRATLVDFRDEAKLRGVVLGGPSLHSAKVALGWGEPSTRTPKASAPEPQASAARFEPSREARPAQQADELEKQLLSNIQMIRSAASGEAARLKEAIREAMRVLQNALDA